LISLTKIEFLSTSYLEFQSKNFVFKLFFRFEVVDDYIDNLHMYKTLTES